MLKKLLKNKKFWTALLTAAAISGAAVNPQYAGVATDVAAAFAEAMIPAPTGE